MPKQITKIIEVTSCLECPFIDRNDGRGHCDAFDKCEKFGFLLNDTSLKYFDLNKIHPECKLENKK